MSLSDEEMHMLVEHLAELHGVSPQAVVSEVTGEQLNDELPAAAAEDSAKPKKRRGPAHWAAWASAMLVMGVLVGAVIVAFLKFVNGPAQADIKPGQAGLPSQAPAAAASTDQLVGISFVLTFPHQFDQVQNLKPDPGWTEQYRVGSKTDYKRLITVSVRPVTGGSTLDDDADFKMRENESDVYTKSVRQVGAETVALMTKSGSQEQTMFWLHQGKLLTIAVTSEDPEDSVVSFMNQILTNIRWKT